MRRAGAAWSVPGPPLHPPPKTLGNVDQVGGTRRAKLSGRYDFWVSLRGYRRCVETIRTYFEAVSVTLGEY